MQNVAVLMMLFWSMQDASALSFAKNMLKGDRVSTKNTNDGAKDGYPVSYFSHEYPEGLAFTRFGWYDSEEKGKNVEVAVINDKSKELVGAIRGVPKRTTIGYLSDDELCVDEFVGIRAFEESIVNDVLSSIKYDICLPPPDNDPPAEKYVIEPSLNCKDKSRWVRLDCKYSWAGSDPPLPTFFASRMVAKTGTSKATRWISDTIGDGLNENLFRNRIRCESAEKKADQLKECRSLLITFVQMENLFIQESERREAIRKGQEAPPSVMSKISKEEKPKSSDNMETIILVVGGVVVALGIGIALYVMTRKSSSRKKPIDNSGIDSENPDEPLLEEPHHSSSGKHRKSRKHRHKENESIDE